MKNILFGILLFSLTTSFPGALPGKYLINTSHSGTIHDLAFDSKSKLLFSAGNDGTVRVWNPAGSEIKACLKVSPKPIQRIALHPQLSHIAVLEGNNLKISRLSVWDWKKEKMLFSIETEDQILYMTYSPKGKYLIYSRADYNSLIVLNPQTGQRLNYLNKDFGIVSYIVVSKNERNVMTYQPSGWINYWDLYSGKNLKQVKTITNLSSISISPNSRYIAASTGDRLVVVDLLQGTVRVQVMLEGISRIGFSQPGSEIAAICTLNGKTELKRWYFSGSELIEISKTGIESAELLINKTRLSDLIYGDYGIFLSDHNGSIIRSQAGGYCSEVAQNCLLEISDLVFGKDFMAVGSGKGIVKYTSDFFSTAVRGSYLRVRNFQNPYSRPLGFDLLPGGELLVWPKGENTGQITKMNLSTGQFAAVYSDFKSPLVQCQATDTGVIAVEKSGLCKILNSRTFRPEFEYTSPGMNKLIAVGEDNLIGGKSSISTFGTPLLQINRITGETVAILDSSLFIYDLIFDRQLNRIITIGVGTDAGGISTVLKLRSGSGFNQEKIIDSFKGEDLAASMTIDEWGRVYCSLGMSSVKAWNGNRLMVFETSDHTARKLYVHNGKLYSLNRDSSITVWNTRTGRILFDIYIFKDFSWAALSTRGSITYSERGKRYINRS